MLGSSLVSKIHFRKPGCGEHGLKLIYSEIPLFKKARTTNFSSFHSKALDLWPSKQLSVNCLHNAGKYFAYRCNSAQATVTLKNENKQTKNYFQELMFNRKKQAHRSVLLDIPNKEAISCALAKCEQFGDIANIYSYSGEMKNCFLLIEFSDEISTQELLSNCQYKRITDVFPIFSRIIQFNKKSSTSLPKLSIEINEDSKSKSSLKSGASISELIEDIYSGEKLTELDMRLRYFFCALVKDSVSGLFPQCDVLPFGSSVNGIGRHGCDLDVMLRLYPEQVNDDGELFFVNKTSVGQLKALQQRTVRYVASCFRSVLPGIPFVQEISHARIPIVKIKHKILSLDCDISVNNMSAVFMSNIIHFCGEIDYRVRPLLYAVKKWAKEAGLTHSTPGSWITNFGLTTLVIFFLQNRPNPILPSLNDALVIIGEDNCPDFRLQYLKSVEEWKTHASLNEESLAVLLKEFLSFLATYPFHENILSLLSGKARPHHDKVTLWMQYPVEEDLNITKNVSEFEFSELSDKARISAKYLGNNLNQKVYTVKDFSVLLGISSFKKMDSKSDKLDVKSLFENNNNIVKHKTAKYRAS